MCIRDSLDSGIEGFSAEDIVAEDCGYVRLPEGGWDWPLWKWKGDVYKRQDIKRGRRVSRRRERREFSMVKLLIFSNIGLTCI